MIRIESVGIEEKEIVYTLVGELLIMQRPFLAPPKSKGPLPQVLQAKVIRTMSQLSSRTALTLLADLIAFAQQLFPQSDSQKELRTNLEDVLYPFSSAALHLDTLENNLNRMEGQKERFGKMPEGWSDAFSRCEQARDCLVQEFLEATATLGSTHSYAVLGAKGLGEQLSSLTTELRSEMEVQEEVVRQIRELSPLLGP